MTLTTVAPLSTHEDIDTRHDGRRLLTDTYELHADAIETIRLALMDHVITYTARMGVGDPTANLWATELWQIHRTMLALGIDSDD